VSAVYPLRDRSAAFVVDGGRAKQRIINSVACNGGDAWVREGLAPDTLIIAYPSTTLKGGARSAKQACDARRSIGGIYAHYVMTADAL
jgi:hypothetical protein